MTARVEQVFHESLRTHEVLSRSFAEAVKAAPDASGGDLARQAVALATDDLGLKVDPARLPIRLLPDPARST